MDDRSTFPLEADAPGDVLRIADRRHGPARAGRGGLPVDGPARQSTDVLLRVMAERHADLGEHVDEVAGLVERVGRRLGVPEDGLEVVVQAAALHDIGKTAVPDAILLKPGPLDADEWASMREHTIIGARIVAAAPSLRQVAALVRASHERWDGAGYPDGLAGEEIPLGARIIAVCDAFDAMTAPRPYRPAWTLERAVAELRRCSGSQFDPRAVDAVCAELAAGEPDLGWPRPGGAVAAQ